MWQQSTLTEFTFPIISPLEKMDLSRPRPDMNVKVAAYTLTYLLNNTLHVGGAAPVAERLRELFLNHLIISPLCLVWVRAPLWPHVGQAKFCLRVCQVFFLGVLKLKPHLLIGPSHMSIHVIFSFSMVGGFPV